MSIQVFSNNHWMFMGIRCELLDLRQREGARRGNAIQKSTVGTRIFFSQKVIFQLRFERGKCSWPWVKMGMPNWLPNATTAKLIILGVGKPVFWGSLLLPYTHVMMLKPRISLADKFEQLLFQQIH